MFKERAVEEGGGALNFSFRDGEWDIGAFGHNEVRRMGVFAWVLSIIFRRSYNKVILLY